MVNVEVITQTCLIPYLRPTTSSWHIHMNIKQILTDVHFLVNVLIVAVVSIIECHCGKSLQSASAVFQGQVVVVVPLVVLPRLSGCHQTESVALGLQRLDANDGIHLGIVLGTRSRNHVDALDIYRLQLFQFALIAYLFIIDIDLRLALGQHLKLAILTLNHGYHRQQVVSRTHIMQNGVLHIHRHPPLSRLILRYLALDLHTFHHIGLWQEGDSADMTHADVPGHRFIADIRHFQRQLLGLAGNHEIAVLIAHTTVDKYLAM